MSNVALGKSVEEPINNAVAATDGVVTGYTGMRGFAEFPWPGTLTVDLGQTHALSSIRFLLWDGLGKGGQRDNRIYYYRLLVSADRHDWIVIHDTLNEGGNGWQEFMFTSPLQARYIRLYGMWNSVNECFHVVEIEAHDGTPPKLNAEVMLKRTVAQSDCGIEMGAALPMQASMERIIAGIERLIEQNQILNPTPFRELTSQLKLQVRDVAALEKSMDSIRREIVSPVQRELALSTKLGRFSVYGFWMGLVGGLLAIISIVLTLMAKR